MLILHNLSLVYTVVYHYLSPEFNLWYSPVVIIFSRTRVILEAEAEAESIKVKQMFIVMNDNIGNSKAYYRLKVQSFKLNPCLFMVSFKVVTNSFSII